MTPAQRDLILAALGLRERDGRMPRWSHRNRFIAGPADKPAWREMEASGWATQERVDWNGMSAPTLTYVKSEPRLVTFFVTRAGAEAAGVLERVREEDLGR